MSSGRIPTVGEAPTAGVELGRADSEIEEDTRDGGPGIAGHGAQMLVDDGADAIEAGPTKGGPSPVRGQGRSGRFDGPSIPIDSQQFYVGIRLEQGEGVSGAPDGGVDDEPRWHRGEEVDDLVGHHRLVCERLGHPQPPDRRNACGWSSRVTGLEVGGGGVFQRCGRGAAHGPDAGNVHVLPCHDLLRLLIGGQVLFGVDVDGVGGVSPSAALLR